MANVTESKTFYPAQVDSAWCKYASVNSSYPLTNPIGKPSSNTTYSQWNLTTGSNAESYVFYKFDLSEIPSDATINSITCSAKAYISQTNSSRISSRQIQLFYNRTTAKGSASTISTSTTAMNLTCGSWTRNELNNIYIRIYAKRGTSNTTTQYYSRFYGATLTVTYTYNKAEYTITTSLSGEGTVSPLGNTTVNTGDDITINIKPNNEDDIITVTDNGVDVTNKLVDGPSEDIYEVNQKSGASYGFQQNYDDNCRPNWWQSTNKAKASSASVSTVEFTVTETTNVIISCICYAESTYDYFLIGPLDGDLSTSASADSNAVFNTKNSNSQNIQTYTFNNVAPGTHSFDVKYFKDSYTDSNWDSAQFTVQMEPTNAPSGLKQYILQAVSGNHIIAVNIGSTATDIYFKVNNQWKMVTAYKKINGAWTKCSKNDIDSTLKYKLIQT